MSLMTLDEAIQHCRDKENCSQCGQEHKQLREWLEELKDLRTRYNIPTPHGRLIDADAYQYSGDLIDEPTIIEAEQGDG